jgi:hypothetical protein
MQSQLADLKVQQASDMRAILDELRKNQARP